MIKLTGRAPAKLNLFLDVTSKLDNGYHEIDSVMQSVSLCDEIDLEINNGSGVEVSCDSPFAPSGNDNIVWRAADRYMAANKINASVKIDLKKKIPSPAGMGGGSADAAAVLRCLNGYYKAMDYNELVELALGIGSDVPFCLKNGTQRVRGLGEKLKGTSRVPSKALFLIAVSGEDVSTPEAYKALDLKYDNFNDYRPICSPDPLINAINEFDINEICKGMYNVFEDVVLPLCPVASRSKNIILQNGAVGAMMSGSGSAVFGIFDDREKAIFAKRKLENVGVNAYLEAPCYDNTLC